MTSANFAGSLAIVLFYAFTGVALGDGVSASSIVLTVAVLSILITAPIGAFLIDASYKKLLEHAK